MVPTLRLVRGAQGAPALGVKPPGQTAQACLGYAKGGVGGGPAACLVRSQRPVRSETAAMLRSWFPQTALRGPTAVQCRRMGQSRRMRQRSDAPSARK